MRAGQLFAKGLSQAAVARRLGVSAKSASRWYRAWQEQGEAGLRSQGNLGPVPRPSGEQRQHVEEMLVAGPVAAGYATDLWTLERIQPLIAVRFGVHYHLSHVWLLLRQMDFSWHKPTLRAKERDEAEVARWRKEEWPRIKRGRAAGALPSSSGTRRASPSGLR